MRPLSLAERISRKIQVQPDGCWLWLGAHGNYGHGTVMADGRITGVHRVVYRLVCGAIPDGLELDHLCRNPRCVNPAHLEPVTHQVNVLRGVGPTASNAAKQFCKRGHEFTPENTIYLHSGNGELRRCKACHRLRQATYKRKR